jgi:hypothetical protein
LSSDGEGQDVVLVPIKKKGEYELAKDVWVVRLEYLLQILKDIVIELCVSNICQCLF